MTDNTVDVASIGAAAADHTAFPMTFDNHLSSVGITTTTAPVQATVADLAALEARVAALETHASALSTWIEKRFAAVQADVVAVEADVHQVALKVGAQIASFRSVVTKGLIEVETKITGVATAGASALGVLKSDIEHGVTAAETEAKTVWSKLFG